MSTIDRTRWPDERIDDLRKLIDKAATKDDVNFLRSSMETANENLRRELTERATGVAAQVELVGRKVENLVGDPVSEKRARRQAMWNVAMGALCGGVTTVILFFATNGGIH